MNVTVWRCTDDKTVNWNWAWRAFCESFWLFKALWQVFPFTPVCFCILPLMVLGFYVSCPAVFYNTSLPFHTYLCNSDTLEQLRILPKVTLIRDRWSSAWILDFILMVKTKEICTSDIVTIFLNLKPVSIKLHTSHDMLQSKMCLIIFHSMDTCSKM